VLAEKELKHTVPSLQWIALFIHGGNGTTTGPTIVWQNGDFDLLIRKNLRNEGSFRVFTRGVILATVRVGDLVAHGDAGDYFATAELVKYPSSRSKLMSPRLFPHDWGKF
jgi:hypothetical protein